MINLLELAIISLSDYIGMLESLNIEYTVNITYFIGFVAVNIWALILVFIVVFLINFILNKLFKKEVI